MRKGANRSSMNTHSRFCLALRCATKVQGQRSCFAGVNQHFLPHCMMLPLNIKRPLSSTHQKTQSETKHPFMLPTASATCNKTLGMFWSHLLTDFFFASKQVFVLRPSISIASPMRGHGENRNGFTTASRICDVQQNSGAQKQCE